MLQEAMDATEDKGPRTQLKAVADAYLAFVFEHRRYPHLIQSTLATNNDHIDVVEEKMLPILDWFEEVLGELAPEEGPLAARQFFITLAGSLSSYVTYSPALDSRWGDEMLSREELERRAEHISWMIDALVDRLEAEGG